MTNVFFYIFVHHIFSFEHKLDVCVIKIIFPRDLLNLQFANIWTISLTEKLISFQFELWSFHASRNFIKIWVRFWDISIIIFFCCDILLFSASLYNLLRLWNKTINTASVKLIIIFDLQILFCSITIGKLNKKTLVLKQKKKVCQWFGGGLKGYWLKNVIS